MTIALQNFFDACKTANEKFSTTLSRNPVSSWVVYNKDGTYFETYNEKTAQRSMSKGLKVATTLEHLQSFNKEEVK